MSMYLGDFREDGDIFFKFTTRSFSTGAPAQLAGTPVLSVYIDEATATEKTTAETYFDLDVDFDTVTGLNNVRIDLSGDAFFATGADYTVVITTGTVGGVSVVGEVVATFSIENRSTGQPAGATLAADIATAQADLDIITGAAGAIIDDSAANDTTISDAVWDEDATGHQTQGTFGQAIGDPVADATTIYQAVATDATGDNIALDIGTVDGNVDTINTNTAGLGGAAMRGTDNAALASVVGALTDVAAAGDPTTADTIMQYVKQLINTLEGTAGIPTYPVAAAPANAVSLAEAIRGLYEDRTLAAASYFDTAADTVANVTTTANVTNDVGITATAVDNIWDEDIVAAHNTADTAGAILNNILPEKNAAFSDIEFLWVAASDHVTPVTGATTTSVNRSIDGGAFGAGTGTLAEVGNGIYQYDASAADMNGTIITFRFSATGGTPGAPDDAFVTIKTSG